MGRVSQRYREDVESGAISADPAQQALLPKLDALLEALERPVKRGFLRRTQASAVKGLYIWGGVGGGKSYLMDLFASSLAVAVRRVHFHAFILKQWRVERLRIHLFAGKGCAEARPPIL